MFNLKEKIAKLARNRDTLDGLMRGAKRARTTLPDAAATHLDEEHGFGSNPGNLRMFSHVPSRLAADPALSVAPGRPGSLERLPPRWTMPHPARRGASSVAKTGRIMVRASSVGGVREGWCARGGRGERRGGFGVEARGA